jgi:hypothetical protein
MTDLATLSSVRTDSRSCISNQPEGIRQMARTTKAPTSAGILTTVEPIKAKYGKELSEIRAQAIKNEQSCAKMRNHCVRLATAAAAKEH